MLRMIKYIFIILALFIILIVFFPLARSLLIINEEPKKAEVIIVLSGETGRLEKAAELYHEDYASLIMLSDATEAGTTPKEAVALGIQRQHLILEKEATSTYTNALHTKEKMEEHNLDSAIVVSSDYHMRRVELVFERVYRNSGIDLTYVASFYSVYAKDHNIDSLFFISKEYAKLAGYLLGLYKFIDL